MKRYAAVSVFAMRFAGYSDVPLHSASIWCQFAAFCVDFGSICCPGGASALLEAFSGARFAGRGHVRRFAMSGSRKLGSEFEMMEQSSEDSV